MSLRVTPLEGKSFGCTLHGLSLHDAMPTRAQWSEIVGAFETHGLVVLPQQKNLTPTEEVAFYRRLRQLWPADTEESESDEDSFVEEPAAKADPPPHRKQAESMSSKPPASWRARYASSPGGYREISIMGNGLIKDHFGINDVHARPANWHEEKSLEWHLDGPGRPGECTVLSWMSCYKVPTRAQQIGVSGGSLEPPEHLS
jgi:alpha-ketoglutarate-dependent taurine dioxygenase